MISKLVNAINLMKTCIYMNIKGQGHSSTLVQDHSDSTFSNFSLETSRPIEAKFHVELPCNGGSNGSGHMTSMAAMPILSR